MTVVDGIERVTGGYIVTARFPYGNYSDNRQVICKTFRDVIDLLVKCANNGEHGDEQALLEQIWPPARPDSMREAVRDAQGAFRAIVDAQGDTYKISKLIDNYFSKHKVIV